MVLTLRNNICTSRKRRHVDFNNIKVGKMWSTRLERDFWQVVAFNISCSGWFLLLLLILPRSQPTFVQHLMTAAYTITPSSPPVTHRVAQLLEGVQPARLLFSLGKRNALCASPRYLRASSTPSERSRRKELKVRAARDGMSTSLTTQAGTTPKYIAILGGGQRSSACRRMFLC